MFKDFLNNLVGVLGLLVVCILVVFWFQGIRILLDLCADASISRSSMILPCLYLLGYLVITLAGAMTLINKLQILEKDIDGDTKETKN